jgi:hypothetical protein
VAIIRSLKVEDRFLNNQQVIMNRFSTYAASKQTGANWTDKGTTKQSDSSARDDARDSPTRGTEQNRTERTIQSSKQWVGFLTERRRYGRRREEKWKEKGRAAAARGRVPVGSGTGGFRVGLGRGEQPLYHVQEKRYFSHLVLGVVDVLLQNAVILAESFRCKFM